CPGRNVALHGIDAQREGAPVYVPARREIRDHQAVGWNKYERAGLLRNLRAGVVGIGKSFQSRSLDRRREKLDCCRTHSAGIVEGTDSLSASVAMGWPVCNADEPSHGRERR